MRRKDREITNFDEIKSIIDAAMILHLALFDEHYPYIVPLHYGCDFSDGKIVLYMHCAKEGHKLNLIKANSSVCVEIETDVELISGGHIPCNYGSAFSSVVARGTINIPVSSEEKIHGLKLLMKHQTGKDFDINEQMADTVEVLKFVADSYSAKSRANSRTG